MGHTCLPAVTLQLHQIVRCSDRLLCYQAPQQRLGEPLLLYVKLTYPRAALLCSP